MNKQRIKPGPGQESVWDYPRPPRLEDSAKQIKIVFGGIVIADSQRAKRVLETSHPPVYYLPPADVQMAFLHPVAGTTWCEWKGQAAYYALQVGDAIIAQAAWSYRQPTAAFAPIKDYIAFYPSKMEACYVDGERVQAQAGDFYGGWITNDIVGPFKGEPGTWGW